MKISFKSPAILASMFSVILLSVAATFWEPAKRIYGVTAQTVTAEGEGANPGAIVLKNAANTFSVTMKIGRAHV